MSTLIDIFVTYQEDGLPHEKMIEIPSGLSNAEFISFVHASIGESANILNIINLDNTNRQKPAISAEGGAKKGFGSGGRPERRSDSRPSFGGGASRPYKGGAGGYGASRGGDDKPTGGYAGRSPRDGARPPRAGFGSRPARGDSRDSRMGSSMSRSKKAPSRSR